MRLKAPLFAVVALLAGVLAGCGPPPALVDYVAERNPEVLFHAPAADSLVALTLDDGPHPALTPKVLDVLAAHDAKATFFLMGSKVEGNEAVVQRIAREGHELGNHMMTTWPSALLSAPAFEARLRRAHRQLAPFADTLRWFRPASGWFTGRIRAEADSLGYDVALGSVYPNDAQNPFPSYHIRYVLRHVRSGSVIVLHEGMASRRSVLAVLRRILPVLQKRGYRVVTLSHLARAAQNERTDRATASRAAVNDWATKDRLTIPAHQ